MNKFKIHKNLFKYWFTLLQFAMYHPVLSHLEVATNLSLFGTGDIFIPLSLLDQILSADFFSKFPNFFWGENLHQLGYFDTLPGSLSLVEVALEMIIFLAFWSHARQG